MPDLGFPVNIVDAIITSYKLFMVHHTILDRPLRFTDPAQSVGVYAVDLTPDQENASFIGQTEPAINRYTLRVQNLVKASDEQTGRRMFAVDSKTVRVILYRDQNLLLQLNSLQETLMGAQETLKRFGVARTRYLNTELKSQFTYLAQTDIWAETEVIKL